MPGISKVILSYRTDAVWTDVPMTQVGQDKFNCTIPAMPYQTSEEYKITAYDNFNN